MASSGGRVGTVGGVFVKVFVSTWVEDATDAAAEVARPWGVDVASGVERGPHRKDGGAMAGFVAAARSAGDRVECREAAEMSVAAVPR